MDTLLQYWVNSYTANLGLGVFHSGVEVHGEEFVYGGHPFSFTGIFPITPRDPTELGDQFRFRLVNNLKNLCPFIYWFCLIINIL